MKSMPVVLTALMLGLAGQAVAGDADVSRPFNYVSTEYLSFDGPSAPSTAAATESPDAPAPCYGYSSCPSCPAKPWTLPQPCFLQQHRITVGGWVEQGVSINADNPNDRFNGPVATNDRSDEYQLNQTWLFLNRKADTHGCGWDWGGRIDLVYGTDWRFGRCLGLENRINSADDFYGMVLPQFYYEVAYNDLSVKMGHYATDFGYEMIPAPGNFFYSHCYAMCYAQPILVTGVQADYKLSDNWLVSGGFDRGWMMFEDNNEKLDFLGGVKWTSDDKETSLAFAVTSGPQDAAGDNNRYAHAVIFTEQVSQRLQYVLQHNYGFEEHGVTATGGDAQWYGLDQYLIYKLTDRWSAGLRMEWFCDHDGTRVAGIGNWIGSDRGWQGAGFAGDFYEITAGLNWRPHPNFVLRPELRWDWYDGPANTSGQLPFNDGTSKDQFLAAMDLIFTF